MCLGNNAKVQAHISQGYDTVIGTHLTQTFRFRLNSILCTLYSFNFHSYHDLPGVVWLLTYSWYNSIFLRNVNLLSPPSKFLSNALSCTLVQLKQIIYSSPLFFRLWFLWASSDKVAQLFFIDYVRIYVLTRILYWRYFILAPWKMIHVYTYFSFIFVFFFTIIFTTVPLGNLFLSSNLWFSSFICFVSDCWWLPINRVGGATAKRSRDAFHTNLSTWKAAHQPLVTLVMSFRFS